MEVNSLGLSRGTLPTHESVVKQRRILREKVDELFNTLVRTRIESLNIELNAMACSNSDCRLIAVLDEYGYRPLNKKIAEGEVAK